MSTWMYLECHDHTPPLRAESESGQHYSDLPRIREEIANRSEVIAWADARGDRMGQIDPETYFRSHSAAFLRAHPHCDVRIMTEYNEDVTKEET